LKCFDEMKEENFCRDHITFVYGLKACGGTRLLDRGRQTHSEVERLGFLHEDCSLGTALVEMYAKNGAFVDARHALDILMVRNTALWNVLMEGYHEHGRNEEVLMCFEEMQLEGASPNVVTYLCTLRACGCIGESKKDHEIHALIESNCALHTDSVRNSLANIYAKCGLLERAGKVFDKLMVPNVVSWNALISGYAEMQNGKEVMKCFSQMKLESVFPNSFTYVCSMRACDIVQDMNKGIEMCNPMPRKKELWAHRG
jgi:pentatricopeptide repeat protein